MSNWNTSILRAKAALDTAQYIIVGAGAGLSAAAGLEYNGHRFTTNFAPFINKYGLTDMYSSGFYPFETEEERWGYWAQHISVNRYEVGATPLYLELKSLIQAKPHFIITTNVDSQFEKAEFAKEQLFEVQGNYGYLQCSVACHSTLYNNEELVKEMIVRTVDCKIPTELVPVCPVCGGKMDPHLRINSYFIQNEAWHKQSNAYYDFIQQAEGKNVVYLELGIGFNTPTIIRYPFEKWTYKNKHATLIRLNRDHPEGVAENQERTIAFTADMLETLRALNS